MISGDLTSKERIILEERTAFFVNSAGIVIQEQLNAIDAGVSTRKLYKILANVIIDWHWLSHDYPDKFKFNGVGELVWIPHKFGGIAQITPSIDYDFQLYYGLFPNFIKLFESSVYSMFGLRGIKSVGDKKYILFPTHIDYDVKRKSRVELQEQHYWEKLVKIYSKLNDAALDALASCRTNTLSSHSLWIQLVMWKRYMGFTMDHLRWEDRPPFSEVKGELKEDIAAARACIKQIFVKINYINHVGEYLTNARGLSLYTEFSSLVPSISEMPSSLSGKKNDFVECSKVLEALHDICMEFLILIGLNDENKQIDLAVIESKLAYIKSHVLIDDVLTESGRWHSLFLNIGTRKEIANLLLSLIEGVFSQFEKKLDVRFERLSGHYKMFLENSYPLPITHFVRGN